MFGKKEGKIRVLDIEMNKIAFGNYWKTVKGIEKEIPGGRTQEKPLCFLCYTIDTQWWQGDYS